MNKSSGFTLIEVLVSVVILSVGIVAVLIAFETATVALGEMRDSIWAGNVAQHQLDQLRIKGYAGTDIGSGYASGIYPTYYSQFNWEYRISDAGLSESGGDVREVRLIVSRTGSTRRRDRSKQGPECFRFPKQARMSS